MRTGDYCNFRCAHTADVQRTYRCEILAQPPLTRTQPMAAATPLNNTPDVAELFLSGVSLKDAIATYPDRTDLPAKYLELAIAAGKRVVPWIVHYVDSKALKSAVLDPLLGRPVSHIRTSADVQILKMSAHCANPDTVVVVDYEATGGVSLAPFSPDIEDEICWDWDAPSGDFVEADVEYDGLIPRKWSAYWASKPLFLNQMGPPSPK